ncbi:MAG: substrate-binding domain-containing protein [Granulosicoccus sp.]|nr:substrate-binding domain-containing protein [Granulosicoccus sp.]
MKLGFIAGALLVLYSVGANAQEVVLTAKDGSISLTGQLIEFKDDFYTIDTEIGQFTVESGKVMCEGVGCPELKPPVADFAVSGHAGLSDLVNALIPLYTETLDANRVETTEGLQMIHAISDADNTELANITVVPSSTSEGLTGLQNQEIAIALSGRIAKADELPADGEVQADSTENSQSSHVVALDALVMVVSDQIPINEITLEQAAKIFSGDYDNWSELGGPDAAITLYGPTAESDAVQRFNDLVLASQENTDTKLSDRIQIVDDVAARVADDSAGIGYTYFSRAEPAKVLSILDVCGISLRADPYTIKAEQYPLTERLYAYSHGQDEAGHAAQLLRFMQSEDAQQRVSDAGWVDQRIGMLRLQEQGQRFAHTLSIADADSSLELIKAMATDVLGSDRLSITLRFETGSSRLDERAQYDIERLARMLQSEDYAYTNVQFLGFTDSVGDYELNKELSQRRATQMRDALLEYDPGLALKVKLRSVGYGELSPIACNETASGRAINRRVEVWIDKRTSLPQE